MSGGHFKKICSNCFIEKDICLFCRDKQKKDGRASVCRECMGLISRSSYGKKKKKERIRSKEYRNKNIEKEKCRRAKYLLSNREAVYTAHREYYKKNKEACLAASKDWGQRNKEHLLKQHAEYAKKKRHEDLNFKISCNLRQSIRRGVKAKGKNKTLDILGCSIQDFRAHLERMFPQDMTWANYGRTGWHIDHIKPCCMFDLTKIENVRDCFHFTNLQPLWATDNHKKGGRYVGGSFPIQSVQDSRDSR